jgi:hypothetical protein
VYRTPSSTWQRGASIAGAAGRPWSTTPTSVCRIAERMRFEPAAADRELDAPSRSTTVGAIIDGIRVPGGEWWKPSGLRSSSPMMLFRWIPGAGHDDAAALAVRARDARRAPSPSTTVTCVVAPRRLDTKRRANAGSASRR